MGRRVLSRRRYLLAPVFALVLAACTQGADASSVSLSDDEKAYLDSVSVVQGRVDTGFEQIGRALEESYFTREVFIGAVADVGYPGLAASAVTSADALVPPTRFEDDHRLWVEYRQEAIGLADTLVDSVEGDDLYALLSIFTQSGQDFGVLVNSVSRDFCLAIASNDVLCEPPDNLPGGDYGQEVYEILRAGLAGNLGLFDFVPDMEPEERALRLEQVQPFIEANLKGTGDALKVIDPPSEFEDEHVALVQFYEEQYATALAITAANAERDTAEVLRLFNLSGVNEERALAALSGEYLEIAAPFVDQEG
ncbi:MAG: hypothetical protein U9N56_07170 [Actinomycetota bacterium]|nr:hypothetical protein [Actinomycetota bacterium]